jgi:hypothetical protein
MLPTSAAAKYRQGSKNENIGNIGENIEKCRKNGKNTKIFIFFSFLNI